MALDPPNSSNLEQLELNGLMIITYVDADVIGCETVINPMEMFPHMTAAAAAVTDDEDDDEDIKFIFTIRFTHISFCWSCLVPDTFVRMSRRAIAMMFVRLSVRLSVWDGHAL